MDVFNKIKETREKAWGELQKTPINIFSMPKLSKITHKISKKSGKIPGTVVYVGKERKDPVKIQVIDYTKSILEEFDANEIEDVFKFKNKKSVTWINIAGIYDTEIIKKVGEHFELHSLLLEDVANTHQRPKLEEFDSDLFFVLKMITYNQEKSHIQTEQVSLVLGKGFVISFQEKEGDVFEPIRQRLRESKGRIRIKGSDYLAYTLLDIIVDNYFHVLEQLGEQIENLETSLIEELNPKNLNIIYGLKRELLLLRKSVWPLREVISSFHKGEFKLVHSDTALFVRDLYDHTIQVIDTIETFRDMLSGMLDLYISITSNKMNEVMKVLTIIATIFIPLTFIAGIYGMNFEYMPELEIWWFYPLLWIVMILVGILMFLYFKKKRWV